MTNPLNQYWTLRHTIKSASEGMKSAIQTACNEAAMKLLTPIEYEEVDSGWELFIRPHREAPILIGLLKRDGKDIDLREGEWPTLDENKYPGAKLTKFLHEEVARMEAENSQGVEPKRRTISISRIQLTGKHNSG